MPNGFETYLTASSSIGALTSQPGFEQQKRNIERLVETVTPERVACLGAGALNDIPYGMLVTSGAQVYLIDWAPGTTEHAVSCRLIELIDGAEPSCVYCCPEIDNPQDYCTGYRPGPADKQVCESYAPIDGATPGCEAFARGTLPIVQQADVTAGYASGFGRGVKKALDGAHTWKQALQRGNRLAKRTHSKSHLDIEAHSVDLVTSSLVVSQFEHEPYGYFSMSAAAQLGRPSSRDERRLAPALALMRDTLIKNQLRSHCEEIGRILSPDGRCYLSFETFHRPDHGKPWFLVEEMTSALSVVSTLFDFDFELLDARDHAGLFHNAGGSSFVQSFVLRPKTTTPP